MKNNLRKNSKIKIIYKNGEITIEGNKDGLMFLADICYNLSNISDDEAKTAANHYHIADYMNNAEKESIPTIILYNPNL